MKPIALTAALLLLLIAQQSHAADKLDQLDDGLAIRRSADTFDQLKAATKPDFVWGDHNMAWIDHDQAGKPIFAFNRAYELRLTRGPKKWHLLETATQLEDSDFDYTRHVDSAPVIISRDSARGTVYQASWTPSSVELIGAQDRYRTLFFLCDADHHWHLLGEGPTAREQYFRDTWIKTSIVPRVRWVAGNDSPARIDVTTVTAYENEDDTDQKRNPLDLTIRSDSRPDTGKLVADPDPGKPQTEYVLTDQAETVDALVTRLATHLDMLEDEDAPGRAAMRKKWKAALLKSNPDLPKTIPAGTKVIIPEVH